MTPPTFLHVLLRQRLARWLIFQRKIFSHFVQHALRVVVVTLQRCLRYATADGFEFYENLKFILCIYNLKILSTG